MKRIIITKILVSLLLIGFFSCEKLDVPKDTPLCIKKKIKEQKDECLNKVLEYEYKGSVVYLFEPANCPGALFNLYDENCDHICSPAGGISGNGDGKCDDFYQTGVEKKLIWAKE